MKGLLGIEDLTRDEIEGDPGPRAKDFQPARASASASSIC